MSTPPTEIGDVLAALAGPGLALGDAESQVPAAPGLYAIHASAPTWLELGLRNPPDARPLYVGKAEYSLASRDLKTHFGNGRTGSSTVRRSFAALLREQLSLTAQPRNPAKPERFSNYGLPPGDDARLTAWMRTQLRLATWATDRRAQLSTLEGLVLAAFEPPLNLKEVTTVWRDHVKGARALMAAEAERNGEPAIASTNPPSASVLDENQVIARLCETLSSRGFTIEQQLRTNQQGVDIIARDTLGVRHYIEAKGATSSRLGSKRHGTPYGSAEVRINVAEALYTATAVVARKEPGVRSGVAFQDDDLHRRYVEPLMPALKALAIDVHWVTASK